MYRGTTPTLPVQIRGVDLTDAKLFLSIRDGRKGQTTTLTTPDDFTVSYDSEKEMTVGEIALTQEQTLALSAGACEAQIRFVFPDGQAGATVIRQLGIQDVILKGVISYDG